MRPASLLLPLATLVGYLLTGSFFLRSSTTLLCLAIVLVFGVVRERLAVLWWIVAAFAFSFGGDYVLGHWGGDFTGFVCGVGLFLLAHLGYVGYSLRLGRMPWLLFTVLAFAFGTYYVVLLRPGIGDVVTRIAVVAYILVSCLSMAAAMGIGCGRFSVSIFTRVLYIIGVGSLLFSDLLIAQKRFLHDGTLYSLMMPTYFASQLFITASVIQRTLKSPSNHHKRWDFLLLFLFAFSPINAETADSVAISQLNVETSDSVAISQLTLRDHLGFSAGATIGYMTNVAGAEPILHSHTTAFYDLRLRYQTRPEDGNAYDALFRFPTIHAGIVVGDLTHIDVYRNSRPYHSTLGVAIAPYYGFHRNIIQSRRWSLGYDLLNGIAFCTNPYNPHTNADNEFIGGHIAIFLGIGLEARYRVSRHWTLSAAFDFKHLSAASMVRPNLGVNSFGPMLGVTYDLASQPLTPYSQTDEGRERIKEAKKMPHSRFYFELSASVIPKALPDEFNYLVSQNVEDPSKCPLYLSYSTMLSAMYRYLPHHSSGIELDYTYIPYTDHLQELDMLQKHDVVDGRQLTYSPHVVGIGVRHDVFFRHLTVNLCLGAYLYRHQGWRAETWESKYIYEMIGVRYSLPFTNDRLFVGYNVKAHRFSRVDGMHFGLGWRFW